MTTSATIDITEAQLASTMEAMNWLGAAVEMLGHAMEAHYKELDAETLMEFSTPLAGFIASYAKLSDTLQPLAVDALSSIGLQDVIAGFEELLGDGEGVQE